MDNLVEFFTKRLSDSFLIPNEIVQTLLHFVRSVTVPVTIHDVHVFLFRKVHITLTLD